MERWSSAAPRKRGADGRASPIAGKTGTASKLVNGRYSKSDYNASFVGFVPSRNPALTIVVVIDSPHAKGYYGGTVVGADLQADRRGGAAPPRDRTDGESAFARDGRRRPRRADPGAVGPHTVGGPVAPQPVSAAVPDGADARPARTQRARSAADADAASASAARMSGTASSSNRSPAAGTVLGRANACVLKLGRHAVPPEPGDSQ